MVKENRIGRANVRKVGYACAMNKIGYILVFLEDETLEGEKVKNPKKKNKKQKSHCKTPLK